ncbi:zinc ribbon domain-containing protein [Lactococcus termiticola]|uniref:DZANK-type domain-containing protein n=1 Tax=Lactococcus termiticola TaxID=2169526 RepID=A0A2R5HHE7_9LACT|nr:zinc ribbon domain-containing protein [Lactococcus termiticola]GBG97402.1 hypothetical protein NtB2_01542 [Lactococcus termiticola]
MEKCKNCGTDLIPDAKFCMNCGEKVDLQLICSGCGATLPPGAAFCFSCGKAVGKQTSELDSVHADIALGDEDESNTKEIVLGNEELIKLRAIYYDDVLKLINGYSENMAVGRGHDAIYFIIHSKLYRTYLKSVNNCFNFLLYSGDGELSKRDQSYISEKKDEFLSTESLELFNWLQELEELSDEVLRILPSKSNGIKGLAGSFISGYISGSVNTEAIDSLFGNSSESKEKDAVISKWDHTIDDVFEELDNLWNLFIDLLDVIEKNTAISWEIDSEALTEHFSKKNPIESVLEKHLEKNEEDSAYFYFNSEIPVKKKVNAKESYVRLDEGEEIICLYDSTLFGGAKEGICFTTTGVYWKGSFSEGNFIDYHNLEEITIKEDTVSKKKHKTLCINGIPAYAFTGNNLEFGEKIRNALDEIKHEIEVEHDGD